MPILSCMKPSCCTVSQRCACVPSTGHAAFLLVVVVTSGERATSHYARHPLSRMQVKAGSIFDNILVCDDPDFAKAEAEKNIVPLQTKEKEMKKKADDEEAEKRRKEDVSFPPALPWGCWGLSLFLSW